MAKTITLTDEAAEFVRKIADEESPSWGDLRAAIAFVADGFHAEAAHPDHHHTRRDTVSWWCATCGHREPGHYDSCTVGPETSHIDHLGLTWPDVARASRPGDAL